MKYQSKFTKKVVDAKKFKKTQQVQLLKEGKVEVATVLEDQWLVTLDDNNQQVLNNDVFEATYIPYKELLLD